MHQAILVSGFLAITLAHTPHALLLMGMFAAIHHVLPMICAGSWKWLLQRLFVNKNPEPLRRQLEVFMKRHVHGFEFNLKLLF